MHKLVKAHAYPNTFASMTLEESRFYFGIKPQGLTLPMGSWYTQNAFNPPSEGGLPEGFELGIMQFPSIQGGACNECKTVGIDGSYAINSRSKNKKLAVDFLNIMATPWWGEEWLKLNSAQSAMVLPKNTSLGGPHAAYFKELQEADANKKWFIGMPLDYIHGFCRSTFIQVLNQGLPSGIISPRHAASMMNAACYKP